LKDKHEQKPNAMFMRYTIMLYQKKPNAMIPCSITPPHIHLY